MPAALSHGSLSPRPALRLGVMKRAGSAPGAAAVGEAAAASPEWLAEWNLRRNCSLSPAQVFRAWLLACGLSGAIALGFWWVGARFVLPFALIEVSVLGLALLVYARHAGDRDLILLGHDTLRVERQRGGRLERVDLHPRWVRVEPRQQDGSLVGLSAHGQQVSVGRFVHPGLRHQLASELRWALRHLPAQP